MRMTPERHSSLQIFTECFEPGQNMYHPLYTTSFQWLLYSNPELNRNNAGKEFETMTNQLLWPQQFLE
ncbi:hypothetical protein TNCV_1490081 [Trichonephila clavipes]|nr:hypothetical protein TNCV_1490081 [Trichonephila clavipes]